jgi:hypothetical protein
MRMAVVSSGQFALLVLPVLTEFVLISGSTTAVEARRPGARREAIHPHAHKAAPCQPLASAAITGEFIFATHHVSKPFAIIENRDELGRNPDQENTLLAGQYVSQDLWKFPQQASRYRPPSC